MRTLGLATALAIATVLPAMASGPAAEVPVTMKKGRAVVACPATLPSPGGGTAKVLETNAFDNDLLVVYPLPETEDLTYLGPCQLQMDCIYEEGLHLTLEVPGYPVKCHAISPPNGGLRRWPAVCITRPGPDGKLGPVRQIPAEPITLETMIQGFGLRWPPERVMEAARAGGYAAEPEKGKIVAIREADRVEIFLSDTTGLSREVVWSGPMRTSKAELDLAKTLGLRFGLTTTVHLTPTTVRYRRTPMGQPVLLDTIKWETPGREPLRFTVHLIDLADPANEGAR